MKPADDAAAFEVVTDPGRFESLAAEWDDLLGRTREHRFTQSFAWRSLGWATTGAPRGRNLCVVVLRRAGRAVLIWPLTVRRRLLLWRVATQLGPEFTDYDAILVEDGPDAADHIGAAWAFIRRQGLAHAVIAQHVRHGSAAYGLLSHDRARRAAETLPSPFVSWQAFATWADYWAARGKNLRQSLGRKTRRFDELGKVTFEQVCDAEDYGVILSWTLQEKLAWMARTGLGNDFMDRPEFQAFLSGIFAASPRAGAWRMFVLKLDGRVVAAKLGALDGRRFEGFLAAQDPELAAFSPGLIILSRTLQWLFARGLEYDFRIGEEPYKRDWATGDCPATTFRLASGPWGEILLALEAALETARRTKDALRTLAPAGLRRHVKGALRALSDTPRALGPRREPKIARAPAGLAVAK